MLTGKQAEAVEFVQKSLKAVQDLKNKAFMERLIPNIPPQRLLGVRTPDLRAFSKAFSKNPLAYDFIKVLPHDYYEENAVHGFLISTLFKKDLDRTYGEIDRYLPYVDNWANCDTLAPKYLIQDPQRLFQTIMGYADSDRPFTVRYALVSALELMLDGDLFRPELSERFCTISSDEYYVNIAVAWYFSFALIKQYEDTIPYLQNKRLATLWIHNKTIQKAVESYRITDEQKTYLKSLKLKK